MVAATGIGSGLDIESLVTQLVAAERIPAENRLFQQESELTSEISAFGAFQGALGTLQTSLTALTQASTFEQRTASSNNLLQLSATADSSAAPRPRAAPVTSAVFPASRTLWVRVRLLSVSAR